MLKITSIRGDKGAPQFLPEGKLTKPTVFDLLAVCEPHLAERRQVFLDLSELKFADAYGVTALQVFREQGAVLSRCAGCLEELRAAK